MLLDRHRLTRLIELAEIERRVTGPERLLREEDVAVLVKAAYDDASDAARAEFMTRVKRMPSSAWPWSAVQAATAFASGVVYSPAPGALAPAALVLLRGQADSADADPGNRVPDRQQPEATTWEPLHKALDLWDTATIRKWVAPQGWMRPGLSVASQRAKNAGIVTVSPPGNGGIKPTDHSGGTTPNGNGTTGSPPDIDPTGGTPGAQKEGGGPPPGNSSDVGPTPTDGSPTGFSWRHHAVIAAGATALSTVGVVLFTLSHNRRQGSGEAP